MRGLLKKTRQYLLSKSKVRSYFLYSIGEIALVVVGILIALSIDNWNEQRKDLEKEQRILVQLRDEFNANLQQLKEKIVTRQKMVVSSHKVLDDIDSPYEVNRDSLIFRLVLLLNDPTFDPIVNDLIGSGNIRLIRNEELKRLLTNWSSDVIALQEVEKRWAKLVDELVAPHFVKIGIARDALNLLYTSNNAAPFALDKLKSRLTLLGNSKRPQSIAVILKDRDLEEIVAIAIGLNNSSNIQSDALLNRINKILELLNQEIVA